jgi:hypothetical protein
MDCSIEPRRLRGDAGVPMQVVDAGTVVYIWTAGSAVAADDIKATADTLANAQDNILPSNG